MDAMSRLLGEAARAGVFQLNSDPRQVAQSAADAGLAAWRVDIGHAHDKEDFLGDLARAMQFPSSFGGNWDALADCLRDLSWVQGAKGYVVILEKSKHFCSAHKHEFDEAIDVLAQASAYWRSQGQPFWGLIGGPEGWDSGYPAMPAA